MVVYTLVRDEFSGWYLEAVKPSYQQPIDLHTYKSTLAFFDKVLKLLHPFMPFITEEIYQLLENRNPDDSIMVAEMPANGRSHRLVLNEFEDAKEIVTAIRNLRQQKNIPPRDQLILAITAKESEYQGDFLPVIKKLANIDKVVFVDKSDEGAASFMVKTTQYSIPLGDLVDEESERIKLEEELAYHQGFLNSVMKKLSNANFVKNAPEKVVQLERKKKADAEEKIKTITEKIESIK
jgi:valyl-tRNA synthetase